MTFVWGEKMILRIMIVRRIMVIDTMMNFKTQIKKKNRLFSHISQRERKFPPRDLRRVLSKTMSHAKNPPSNNIDDEITIDGKKYRKINVHKLTYNVSVHKGLRTGALVDRGANGGIAGEDVRVINKTGRQADVQGIDNHQIVDIPIVTARAVINTHCGEAIGIFHINQEEESPILAHLTKRKEIPPGDLRRVLSKSMSHAKKPPSNNIDDEITSTERNIGKSTFIN